MALRLLQQVRDALSHLNPNEVRQTAERPVSIGLTASSNAAYLQMERFLLPADQVSPMRVEAQQSVFRTTSPDAPHTFNIEIVEDGLPRSSDAFSFNIDKPEEFVKEVLEKKEDLGLALARRFPPFRQAVIQKVIRAISRENAIFSLATALPDVIPLLSLPLSAGEFASDSAFLTMNQIRMAFLISAASGQVIGYREQKAEVGSIVAGAFGFRAIARELVGKIPFGGGLVPKAAIAYAGTYVVGLSLERYYRGGAVLNPSERKAAYDIALERGKAVAGAVMETFRKQKRK